MPAVATDSEPKHRYTRFRFTFKCRFRKRFSIFNRSGIGVTGFIASFQNENFGVRAGFFFFFSAFIVRFLEVRYSGVKTFTSYAKPTFRDASGPKFWNRLLLRNRRLCRRFGHPETLFFFFLYTKSPTGFDDFRIHTHTRARANIIYNLQQYERVCCNARIIARSTHDARAACSEQLYTRYDVTLYQLCAINDII